MSGMARKNGENRECTRCGTVFYVKRSKILSGCGVYCSRDCQRYTPPNTITEAGDVSYLIVENKSRGFIGYAIIDSTETSLIVNMNRRWHAAWNKTTSQFYAVSNDKIDGVWTVVILHRMLMGDPKGFDVDHINHNMLDCRRSNLRVCTRGENLQNRQGAMVTSASGIRGVWWDSRRKKWTAELKVKGKKILVGRFDSSEEADQEVKQARSIYMTHSEECV